MENLLSTCKGRSRWTQPWVLWAAAAIVADLVDVWLSHSGKLSPTSRIVLGFLPALLWIACVVAVVRAVRRLDEMGKRLQLQSASIAFVTTIILTFVSMGLTAAKIYTVKATDLGMAGLMIWAIATVFLARRYQ